MPQDPTPSSPMSVLPCDCPYRDDIVLIRRDVAQMLPDLQGRLKTLEQRMVYLIALAAVGAGAGSFNLASTPEQPAPIIRYSHPAGADGEQPSHEPGHERGEQSHDQSRERDTFLRTLIKSMVLGG
jgi:hypothetical protein